MIFNIGHPPRFGTTHTIRGFKQEPVYTQLDAMDAFNQVRRTYQDKTPYTKSTLASSYPYHPAETESPDCVITVEDGVPDHFVYVSCADFMKQYPARFSQRWKEAFRTK